MMRAVKPRVAIITPLSAQTKTGNWHTAARWARFLAPRFRVDVASRWDGTTVDCMIALHARRSAESIQKYASAHPHRPLIVALTGTDLYRDIAHDLEAQRSLQLATQLIVLNECGPQRLPAACRPKTAVVLQSARALSPGRLPQHTFRIAVIGHLRDEKNPRLVWRMLRQLPPGLRLSIHHAGAALDAELGREAAALAAADRRYRWLGDVPRARARQIIRDSHVLLHPSIMEGGAQAVIEAITSHTAVIGSRIDGNVGLLGGDYPGLFAEGDADGARALVERAIDAPGFLAQLRAHGARRAPLFTPQRECETLLRLVDNGLAAPLAAPDQRGST